MSERSDPSESTEWPEWRREWQRARPQISVWMSRGQEWARERQQLRTPRTRAANAVRGLLLLPLNLLTGALVVIAAALGLVVGLLVVSLAAWIGMGIIAAVMTARKGWDVRFGWLLGFALGPIGVLLARTLPTRRS